MERGHCRRQNLHEERQEALRSLARVHGSRKGSGRCGLGMPLESLDLISWQ